MSGVGFKGGLRARANLLTSNFTPFVALGGLYGSGTAGGVASSNDQGNNDPWHVGTFVRVGGYGNEA